MAFPTTSVLDNFDRANSPTSLGANWTLAKNWYGGGFPGILSNQAYSSYAAGNNYVVVYYNAITPGADQESYLTVATKGGSAAAPTEGQAVECRMASFDSPSYRCYEVMVFAVNGANNDTWHINRIDSSTATQLGLTITQEITDGDKIGIEAISDQISAYHYTGGAWANKGTRTDATYNDGRIGWYMWGDKTDWRVDDFGGGTVVAGGTTISVSDTASGTDAKPTLSASLSGIDTGQGIDAKPTLAASLSRSDTGQGTDSRTLSASLSRTDAGQGSDNISPPPASFSLPESGRGSEQSTLSASLSRSDTGIGIDNPASLSSLGMSDGALGGDFLDLSALDTINEIGRGSDTLSGLLASLGITENISGSDLLQLLALLSLSDTGSGSDTVNILTALIVAIQDVASGVDGLSISALLSLVDIGNSQEGLSIQVSLSVADTATGTDLESVIKALINAISVADAAFGSESGITISASLNVPEPGYGLDNPTIAASITGYDISITSDSPQIQANLNITDASSASDGLSILQSILKAVQDLASGNDFVGNISASIPVSEFGIGLDGIGQLLASLSVIDFGTGVDTIVTINLTTQIIKISFIIKKSAISFAINQPRTEFGLGSGEIDFSFLDGG